ncbi:hypothetical protein AVEN_128546-2-1, partial [Araneus ventricosus]
LLQEAIKNDDGIK